MNLFKRVDDVSSALWFRLASAEQNQKDQIAVTVDKSSRAWYHRDNLCYFQTFETASNYCKPFQIQFNETKSFMPKKYLLNVLCKNFLKIKLNVDNLNIFINKTSSV